MASSVSVTYICVLDINIAGKAIADMYGQIRLLFSQLLIFQNSRQHKYYSVDGYLIFGCNHKENTSPSIKVACLLSLVCQIKVFKFKIKGCVVLAHVFFNSYGISSILYQLQQLRITFTPSVFKHK